jgi:hypothetical protein
LIFPENIFLSIGQPHPLQYADHFFFSNISTFNGYVDTNAGLGVNLGSYLSFNDTTGTIFSQIAQQLAV